MESLLRASGKAFLAYEKDAQEKKNSPLFLSDVVSGIVAVTFQQ